MAPVDKKGAQKALAIIPKYLKRLNQIEKEIVNLKSKLKGMQAMSIGNLRLKEIIHQNEKKHFAAKGENERNDMVVKVLHGKCKQLKALLLEGRTKKMHFAGLFKASNIRTFFPRCFPRRTKRGLESAWANLLCSHECDCCRSRSKSNRHFR